jgi:hypothetical protein
MHQNAAFQKLKIFMGFSDFRWYQLYTEYFRELAEEEDFIASELKVVEEVTEEA